MIAKVYDLGGTYFKWEILSKGQLISNGLFGILNYSKKPTKKFDLGRIVFVFWNNSRHKKDISKLTGFINLQFL
jgi:hypothetical protein